MPNLSGQPAEHSLHRRNWRLLSVVFLCVGAFVAIGYFFLSRLIPSVPATLPDATTALEPVSIRWLVASPGDPDSTRVALQNAIVDPFNASNRNIQLVLEVVPYDSATDTLAVEISNGNIPDIFGPMGRIHLHDFHGQWLDLAPYIQSSGFDTSVYDPALIEMYQTDEGQVALPFAVFPSILYYNPALFDAAGLNYPPSQYEQLYTMPDGTRVQWSWETVTALAKLLTLDANGNNSTSLAFDRTQIVQYGYQPVYENHLNYIATYWQSGSFLQGEPGSYRAVAPDAWVESWQWFYDGIWGSQPFIPIGMIAQSAEYGSDNAFNSGRIAMTVMPNWYVCCLGELANAGGTFQFGILPSYNGEVHGHIDEGTFRILKDTQHPAEAFEVLRFLVSPDGVEPLMAGNAETPSILELGFSALPANRQAFINNFMLQYPFLTQESWNVVTDSLAYPDIPVADGYMPNWDEAWARIQTLSDVMNNDPNLNLEEEINRLESDLTAIFNGNNPTGRANATVADSPSPTLSVPTVTLIPTPEAGSPSTWIRPADGMIMIYVPEGEFIMDSNHSENLTFLADFWVDQTEVTNRMYALCVAAEACQPPDSTSSYTRSSYYGNPEFDNYPAIYVTQQAASNYCLWAGARLPTDAEWEKAARGTDTRDYPWGNYPDFSGSELNFCDKRCPVGTAYLDIDDGYGDTSPVGSYPLGASPYGALDMAGNVWEWTIDAVYGGGWNSDPLRVGTYVREGRDPGYSSYDTGFRCVIGPIP